MPRKPPEPLSFHLKRFLEKPQKDKIMFCKRFKIYGMWDISPGAILDLNYAYLGLIKICRKLYMNDNRWFIGDIKTLLKD